MPLFFYKLISCVLWPLMPLFLGVRCLKGKEVWAKLPCRCGLRLARRPAGRLLWLHGASVGECLSMLPLVEYILQADKRVSVMMTSGTRTSAKLLNERLPARCFHQLIPLDIPVYARRFVRHFHPDSVLWCESDFWPNILQEIHTAHIPLFLINGRISDRSFRRWQRALWFIAPVLRLFTFGFGQTAEDTRRLQVLGLKKASCVGNLKFASPSPVFDKTQLEQLKTALARRPVWAALSTHPGEEKMILQAHQALKRHFPQLITIFSPRHPPRGEKIRMQAQTMGLKTSLRSQKQPITPDTDIYIADTIGEYGLLYQLAPVIFIGKSLVPFGGQNMLEPMRFSAAVIVGPYTFNFKELVQKAKAAHALTVVQNESELIKQVQNMLSCPALCQQQQAYALAFSQTESQVVARLYDALKKYKGV